MAFSGLLFGHNSDHRLCVVGHTTVVVNYWFLQLCNERENASGFCIALWGLFFPHNERLVYTLPYYKWFNSNQHPLDMESSELLTGLHWQLGDLAVAFIQRNHSFTHSHTDGSPRRNCWPGAVSGRCLVQGHLDTAGDRTSNLLPVNPLYLGPYMFTIYLFYI